MTKLDNDLISRKALLKVLRDYGHFSQDDYVIEAVNLLPTITNAPTVEADSGEAVYQILHSPRHEWQEVSKEVYDSYGSYGEEGKKRILYTSPPKRKWVGLSDEQIGEVLDAFANDYARAIEAKLKEVNGYA